MWWSSTQWEWVVITSNKERASPCSHRSTPCSQHCCLELELLIESLKGLTTRELELLISMWGRLPTCWQGSTSWSKLLLAAPLHCSTTAQTRRKLSQEAPSFMVQLGSPRAVTGSTQSDWRGGFSAKRALNCTLGNLCCSTLWVRLNVKLEIGRCLPRPSFKGEMSLSLSNS